MLIRMRIDGSADIAARANLAIAGALSILSACASLPELREQ